MKAHREIRFPEKSKAARILFSAVSVAIASLCAADGQDPGAFKTDVSRVAVTKMEHYSVEEPKSQKTYTLFMGADIAINLDKDVYKVRDVFGSNWVIAINGQEKDISARAAPLDLKITPNLKLTEVSATVVGFQKVSAYSYDNDPNVLLTRGLSQSASMNADLIATGQNAMNRVDTALNKAMGGAASFVAADDQFSARAIMPKASQGDPLELGSAASVAGASAYVAAAALNQAKNGNEPTGRVATMGLDAMDVTFDIRASRPLHNPYVVTMTRFRATGAKPGMVQNLVYAEAMHPIDEHLSHVHFTETGFPFNYEVLGFQLHIYNKGEEVATNISADRVELTRDEAFEYVKMEYIGAHAKDTLPAVPAMAKLPADLPAKLAQGDYRGEFFVEVSRDGLADEAFPNPACTERINDPYLDSVVKRVRFKPALNNGKPVDGVAAINLNNLAI